LHRLTASPGWQIAPLNRQSGLANCTACLLVEKELKIDPFLKIEQDPFLQ